MDSLLLLCRVDAFLVRGSGMFMHSVRGCVRDCEDCNCVGPAKSLHSSKTAALEGLIPLTPNKPHFCSDGKDEYGEAAKISGSNQAAQMEKD
ncbi:unnamed protein product [Heligmosomoides polygyrus]|uniref:ZP domain-containing protein n=1 Tax=Heligmosomoides polygyrus TaxID=6339 RepID=A0A183F5C6_HELPZ|nr:unnamed protein product [Heligmosomoides polygyrus]